MHKETGSVEVGNIRAFVFEAGQLRDERDNGFHHIKEDPCSVAEHSHRASVLGFLLASQAKACEPGFENVDPNYVVSLVVFHDLHEVRTGDDDLIQKKYCTIDRHAAIFDQTKDLGMMGKAIEIMWREVEEAKTPAGKLAKDAEILERAFTAHELVFKGNKEAQAWIDAVVPRLQSETAKQIINSLQGSDPNEWWKRALGYSIPKPAEAQLGLSVPTVA